MNKVYGLTILFFMTAFPINSAEIYQFNKDERYILKSFCRDFKRQTRSWIKCRTQLKTLQEIERKNKKLLLISQRKNEIDAATDIQSFLKTIHSFNKNSEQCHEIWNRKPSCPTYLKTTYNKLNDKKLTGTLLGCVRSSINDFSKGKAMIPGLCDLVVAGMYSSGHHKTLSKIKYMKDKNFTPESICNSEVNTHVNLKQTKKSIKDIGATGFRDFDEVIKSCGEDAPKEKLDLIGSKFYFLKKMLSNKSNSDLEKMAYADILQGKRPLEKVDCANLPYSTNQVKCQNLKTCSGEKDGLQKKLKSLITQSADDYNELLKLRKEYFDELKRLKYMKSNAKTKSENTNFHSLIIKQKALIRLEVPKIELTMQAIEKQFPQFEKLDRLKNIQRNRFHQIDLDKKMPNVKTIDKIKKEVFEETLHSAKEIADESKTSLNKNIELELCLSGQLECNSYAFEEDISKLAMNDTFDLKNDSGLKKGKCLIAFDMTNKKIANHGAELGKNIALNIMAAPIMASAGVGVMATAINTSLDLKSAYDSCLKKKIIENKPSLESNSSESNSCPLKPKFYNRKMQVFNCSKSIMFAGLNASLLHNSASGLKVFKKYNLDNLNTSVENVDGFLNSVPVKAFLQSLGTNKNNILNVAQEIYDTNKIESVYLLMNDQSMLDRAIEQSRSRDNE